MKDYILLAGSSNQPLAARVAEILGIQLGQVDLTRFADGEIRPWVADDLRDKTVIMLQSLSYPMDTHLMELVLMGDAVRRGAPKAMVAVIPYMGYARQDKQHRVGEPVSARVIAKILEVSKFREIITVDLHNDAIVGFFQIPVQHLSALPLLVSEIKKLNLPNGVVISPDVGGVKRARMAAYALELPLVVMEKKRFLDRHDTSETFQIIGDVHGKDAIIIDDVMSSGGTIVQSAKSLKDAGVTSVTVGVTHGVLSGDAVSKLKEAPIDHCILTDTIAISSEKQFDSLTTSSTADLLAQAIRDIVR